MAWGIGGNTISYLAAEDLSDHQYEFVVLASETTVGLANALTDMPIGILQNAPESGEEAIVQVDGISKLVMNYAASYGQRVQPEWCSNVTMLGRGAIAITATYWVAGIVIKGASAASEIGTVKIVIPAYSLCTA